MSKNSAVQKRHSVLAADGTEIVKRRGYIAPAQMLSLLDAIVARREQRPDLADRHASG